MSGWRNRFDAFAARFSEKAGPRRDATPPPAGATDDYWRGLQELFTRDVTERGLRELIQQDTAETVRFFTREVDLAGLAGLPWYRRYPRVAWRVFLHIAFRLSPARRLLFAVAVPLLAFGWLHAITWWAADQQISLGYHSLLGAATFLFALLALELKDKLALKGDLEVARQIQFGLLPFEPLVRPGAFVSASMRPANTVGGDYFDVIDLDDERLAVTVGDVAGKGMPAALLMALLQGSLRTLITAGLRGPELMAKLNDHLCVNIPSNRLVTLFYAEYDPRSGELAYVNAGHNAPFILRGDGTLERLPATGVALGVVPHAPFEARLAWQLDTGRGLSDRALIDAVCQDVLAFCGPVRPRDDMTFMVLARPGTVPPVETVETAAPTPAPGLPLPRWS